MMSHPPIRPFYSIVIAVNTQAQGDQGCNKVGDIEVDWVDFTREKSTDMPHQSPPDMVKASPRKKQSGARAVPGSSRLASNPTSPAKRDAQRMSTPNDLSLQPLLGHFPGPNPLATISASGTTSVGRGVVHLFRHAPPPMLIASLDAHPVGESSTSAGKGGDWAGDKAEGEDGSLIAILAVPAWMRPADFLEFIGGWATCLEGVRMIREATTPNRSIVLLKFRDPLQAGDFLVIFTGRPFSSLDARETCHPIRIHHLVLHHVESPSAEPTAIPAFPPSTYSSRAKALTALLTGVPQETTYELPSCPVCLERLDSTVTGLVTLPCAHTFDCDCLQKWGDSRCPVCRVSHLLLSAPNPTHLAERDEITRLSKCATCGLTSNNWICVICGVVGCGRYDPGKAHARRHWEESGHVLAMELDTQRVWDYNGDNYVHRLIQTRTDGKLVELPSASSLVTPSVHRSSSLSTPSLTRHRSPSSSHNPNAQSQAGPSSDDQEKMSTIEAITLEYSYLLSSQLEAMRQHYESQTLSQTSRIDLIEAVQARAAIAEKAKQDAEAARLKAEKRAEKAAEITRSLQASLSAERAMAEGLSARISRLREQVEQAEKGKRDREDEVKGLEETVRDLMFSLEAGLKIKDAGGDAGQGGDLVVVPGKGKKKGKK